MRPINKIIVHCSDSDFGDVETIRRWHVQDRKWSDIGYHYVILNGVRESGGKYDPSCDGLIEKGRPIERYGAHCSGHNKDSIGICLIGQRTFTGAQLYHALPKLLDKLTRMYGLDALGIYAHYEFNKHKTCPNIEIDWIRQAWADWEA